jgi:hypothetical protein
MVNDGFSSAELRARLIQKLKETGVQDKLKSQLRAKLYAELKLRTTSPDRHNSRLVHKVIDSLIVGYLRDRGLEFSLSVFLPECQPQILNKSDIIKALQLPDIYSDILEGDKDLAFEYIQEHNEGNIDSPLDLRDVKSKEESSLIIRIFNCFSRINYAHHIDKDTQTNLEFDDVIAYNLREKMGLQSLNADKAKMMQFEERMLNYQRQADSKCAQEVNRQVSEYKNVELVSMRLNERSDYLSQLSRQKSEFETKLLEMKSEHINKHEEESKRIQRRERELEKVNIELRQKLFDETNRIVFKETSLRNEAELQTKEVQMEKDLIIRRYTELQQQFKDLQTFKERYMQKMEDSMASYKIDLNKEFSSKFVEIQVEKTKLDG